MTSKITIIGAGLSGMTAGINLAQDGYEVEIWDGAKTLGQLEAFHPSVHTTPIDPRAVSEYIGIDITSGMTRVKNLVMYIKNKKYIMNPETFHLVERGNRATSLDTLLYKAALTAGVKFRFGYFIKKWDDVPEHAIVAVGLNRHGMEAVNVPYADGISAYARKPLDDSRFKDTCIGWAEEYSTDYCYLSVVNDLMFILVFNRGPLLEKQVADCRRHIMVTEGLSFPQWDFHYGHIPLLDRHSLRLFKGNRILTGTLSGMIDPAALYGIHGALMSGKVAALAVTDTEKALMEFARLNKHFQSVVARSHQSRNNPYRLRFMDFSFRHPLLMRPFLGLLDNAIPGYERHWALDMLKKPKT